MMALFQERANTVMYLPILFFKIASDALCKSIKGRDKPVEHWLDRAADKFDASLIYVKRTFRVLLLFTPWPLFWALFFQTSTGMVFQAKQIRWIHWVLPNSS